MAIPSYTLCPEARISQIVREIAAAVSTASSMVDGPIYLTGHSAGGHLVTRLICKDAPLDQDVQNRISNVLSISGVHDLRPMIETAMNSILRIDEAEARAESPVLLSPMTNARLTCWVGAGERSEFIRLSALLSNIWIGLGAETAFVSEPDKHHFDVIDGLSDPEHPIVKMLLS